MSNLYAPRHPNRSQDFTVFLPCEEKSDASFGWHDDYMVEGQPA
ncbi:hypothetical protein [Sphingobium sp. HWE2-09]|nr:hypothetical protein [Sphingobium sp. HWE2-09]